MLNVIFFGNGPLADYALSVLREHCNILFHAKTKADLKHAADLKHEPPEAHGILASFGVLIKEDFLEAWEPEGILNIHPSLLPKYRGPSPIETAIINGNKSFSVSIMKLAKAMDAGPIYYQTTLSASEISADSPTADNLPSKDQIYRALARVGATWLVKNLDHLPSPKPQQGTPTFTKKFDRSMSYLTPKTQSAEDMQNQLIAFLGYPSTKYNFFGTECTILDAHIALSFPAATPDPSDSHLYTTKSDLALKAKDGAFFVISRLQPANKRPMDARSFLNGYRKVISQNEPSEETYKAIEDAINDKDMVGPFNTTKEVIKNLDTDNQTV